MRIAIGHRLGRYRIEEEIGAGGMGVVYRAYDEKLERDLAIKVLTPGTLDNEVARKRFRNEARVLSRLNHPSIQTIHDFDTANGTDFLVSELVPGQSLDARLASGPLPEKEVVRIGVQLAQGLAAAHAAGVLHRDLKPANLRVRPDGHVKILDFGLATLSREAVLQLSTTVSIADAPTGVAGTLPYMSPEQLLANQIDERSDIYSAGVTLFELVTRQLPFNEALVTKLTNAILHQPAPSLSSYVPSISPELERIVLKCLEKDPELRYQSAKELASDLRRMEAASVRSATAVQVRVRSRWIVRAIGAAAVAIVAAGLVMFLPRLRERATEGSVSALRWEQLTNFTDSALVPAVSADGKLLAFIRGPGSFGGSADNGQVWFKVLPDNEPVQLSNVKGGKQTLSFAPDGSRLYFTYVANHFTWNTYEVPLLGGQEPKLFMANASGLSWIGKDRLLFSEIREGVHMPLVTSDISRTDERNVYVPADTASGMAHRSALSPDGKWVLLVEMNATSWLPCRLVPFDGSSQGRRVGPDAACTAAQWSPDGKWMYFTAELGSNGFHVWRQRFPDGEPQQITPTGASEEEGIAVMPDGRSLITAAGTRQSAIWMHDGKGDRQLTSSGFSFLPTVSPGGKTVYYLQRSGKSRSYISGELWAADVATGKSERVLPGLVLSHYAISTDGKKVVFTISEGDSRSGVWIAELDRTQPPRQLTSGGEFRAFFGKPGEIIYQSADIPYQLMRMKEDGGSRQPVGADPILHLVSVSPDGRWAAVVAAPVGGHGDRNTMVVACPLDGGEKVPLCDNCVIGFGPARTQAPPVSWSLDGKWMYMALRYFEFGSSKTVSVPYRTGAPPISAMAGFTSEAEFAKIPGARLINEEYVFPGRSPDEYAISRRTVKTNLFRIYLSP